jgi:hypothetical protein
MCLSAFLLGGCGSRQPGVKISGTVTLDNQPLPSGSIKFFYGDQIPAGIGEITTGRFECYCLPKGELRVEITDVRAAQQADKAAGLGVPKIQYLPKRYNAESKLTAYVTESTTEEFQFKLTSKP